MLRLQVTRLVSVPRRVEIRAPELDPEVYADRLLVLAVRAPSAIDGVPIAAVVTLRTLSNDLRAGRRSIPDTLALFAQWATYQFTGKPTAKLWEIAAALAVDPDVMPPTPRPSPPAGEPTREQVLAAERASMA